MSVIHHIPKVGLAHVMTHAESLGNLAVSMFFAAQGHYSILHTALAVCIVVALASHAMIED